MADRQYKSNPWWNTAKRLIDPAKFYITEEQRHVILKRAMDVPFGVCVCILNRNCPFCQLWKFPNPSI